MYNEPLSQGAPAESHPRGGSPLLINGLHAAGVAVFALVVLGLIVALVIRTARLRARVRRLERDGTQLSRTVANVQRWAEQQLCAIRGELTVSRINDSAAEIVVVEAKKRAGSPAPLSAADDDPEATRETIAFPAPTSPARSGQVLEMVPSYDDDDASEEEATQVGLCSPRVLEDAKRYDPRPAELSERRGRAAILVPTFRAPGEESAC